MLQIGEKFGRLTVLSLTSIDKYYHKHYLCQCSCGNQKIVNESNLRTGCTKSCGCLQKENRIKHNMHKTRFYKIWQDMIIRCTNRNHKSYKNYGGRGIKVCNEWKNFICFKNDMYESYLKHFNQYHDTTLDRINNNLGYSKENCTWKTNLEQQWNRQNTIKIYDDIEKKKISIRHYCITHHLNVNTVYSRLKAGKSIKEAIQKVKEIG